jgi:hypothetical protein
MNTSYGHQYYHPDPLPIHQHIDRQETVGELKAVVTPLPIPPTIEPLSHTGRVKSPVDQLASHSQRAIEQYCEEILTVVSSCKCDLCKNCVKTLLSDLISEVLTDTTIVNLSLNKLQRSVDNLTEDVRHLMGGKR